MNSSVDNSKEMLVDKELGPLTILFGKDNGKYPQGNSLVIKGRDKTAIIDPNLGVVDRSNRLPQVDMVIHSHTHEDHVSGSHLFPDVPWYAHQEDLQGITSVNGLMEMYGLPEPANSSFRADIMSKFHYMAKEDAIAFADGDEFDFGGVTLKVIHTPGHTRGHCCFLISWEGSDDRLVYLGDIELTGFGPYYGDAWSNLADFEASMKKLSQIDVRWWLTFHHKGLIDGRRTFLEMLDNYAAVIDSREAKLLDYLLEPRSMDQIVKHRFVYRPGVESGMIDAIEKRSMSMHLDRLMKSGKVEAKDNTFVRVEK